MVDTGDPYNAYTRALFADLAHAGDLQSEYDDSARAEASESTDGARIQLVVGLVDNTVAECRFRAFGCPHLIAAAEWLCRKFEGTCPSELAEFRAADCMGPLAIPIEKAGRILLLEDAIRLLHGRLTTD